MEPTLTATPTIDALTIGVLDDARATDRDAAGVAALISQLSFDRATSVYVTCERADAANSGAGSAATAANAPLLLTGRGGVPDATAHEIERLGASRVVVIGGPRLVPDAVVSMLGASGCVVERADAADAFGAAPAIAYVVDDSYAERLIAEALASALPGPVVGRDARAGFDAARVVEIARVRGCDRYSLSITMAVAAFPRRTPVFLEAGPGAVVLHAPDGVPIPAARVIDALKPSIVAVLGEI